MARKKQVKTVRKTQVQKNETKSDIEELKQLFNEKRDALFVGAITLIIGIGIGLLIPKQYTPPSETIKESNITNSTTKKAVETYTLQEGESLWDVAQKFYGDPYLYTKIAKYNNIENPDQVSPGTTVKIELMEKNK